MQTNGRFKILDNQNIVAFLSDPPLSHQEFKSIIHGINNCRLTHAIRANPVIYKSLVSEFWDKAFINKEGADGEGIVESIVKERKIVVSEQIIREVHKFEDQLDSPTKISTTQIREVL